MTYMLRESDKHFLWALFNATGIIIFWKGIWESIGTIPILGDPWVDLFIGLTMITLSGIIFQQFDPFGGLERGVNSILHHVHTHPKKHEFTIHYYDRFKDKEVWVNADKIRRIEKNMLSLHEHGKEIFIPIHRVRAIMRNKKEIWRL